MKYCCDKKLNEKKDKKCIRKKDGKVFSLPRRFTRKRCKKGVRGFTMRSSCAPYTSCIKQRNKKNNKTKKTRQKKTRQKKDKKIK